MNWLKKKILQNLIKSEIKKIKDKNLQQKVLEYVEFNLKEILENFKLKIEEYIHNLLNNVISKIK